MNLSITEEGNVYLPHLLSRKEAIVAKHRRKTGTGKFYLLTVVKAIIAKHRWKEGQPRCIH